jgi:hypothetical protein
MCRYDIITAILAFIGPLLDPGCWIRLGHTSYEWDKRLRRAMKTGKVSNTGPCSYMVGDEKVWTGNYPCSYGGHYDESYKLPP